MSVLREVLLLVLWLSLPPLLAAWVAGVLAGFLQGATQISDPILSALPKLAALAVVFWIWGPSLFARLVSFTSSLWGGM